MITSFKSFEFLFEDKNYVELYKSYFSEYTSTDGVQMTDELGEEILNADPTENKEYRQWLFNMYKKYDFSEFKIELSNVKELLRIYNLGKQRLPIENTYKNINNAKTFDDLREVTSYIQENELHISKKERLKEKKAKSKIAIHDEYIEIHDDPEWQIIIPLTYPQSRFWCDGAQWCTASPSNEREHYETYSNDSPLYIFHNKKDKMLNHQLFLGVKKNFEFKDYRNSEVSFDDFIKSHPQFIESLLEFWKTNNPVLKDSLGSFLNKYLQDPKKKFDSIATMIYQTDLFSKLSRKDLDKVLILGLKTLNEKIIKTYFDKYPEAINEKLENGLTPIMMCISSKSPTLPLEQEDIETMKMCKYLISKGADGAGTKEHGKSNILLEALYEKKYKTLIVLKDLPNYDKSSKNLEEIENKSAFFISSIKISPNGSEDSLSYKDYSELISSFIEKGMNLNALAPGAKRFTPIVLIISRYIKTQDSSLLEIIRQFLEFGSNPCLNLEILEENKIPIESIPSVISILTEYKEKTGC
jgi:hypothetical protein